MRALQNTEGGVTNVGDNLHPALPLLVSILLSRYPFKSMKGLKGYLLITMFSSCFLNIFSFNLRGFCSLLVFLSKGRLQRTKKNLHPSRNCSNLKTDISRCLLYFKIMKFVGPSYPFNLSTLLYPFKSMNGILHLAISFELCCKSQTRSLQKY